MWGLQQDDVHRLEVLTEEQATQVLLDLAVRTRRNGSRLWRRAGKIPASEHEAARQLAIRLGRLPLALHLAGTAIGSPYSSWASFAEYRQEFDTTGPALLAPAPDSPRAADPRSIVMRTWELSLDALAAHRLPQARPLLRLLSCYAAAVPIPVSIVDPDVITTLLAPCVAFEGYHAVSWARDAVLHACNGLARVGLIDLILPSGDDGHGRAMVVHPLVAETNRAHLTLSTTARAEADAIRRAAVQLLADAVESLSADDPEDWPTWRLLTPHLDALLEDVALLLPQAELAVLLTTLAATIQFYEEVGAALAGEQQGRNVLARMSPLSPEEPAVLNLRYRIAYATGRAGRWEQAEDELRQVLSVQLRVFGPDDRRTLATRHELAAAAGQLGRWKQAEAEYRELLDAQLRVLDPDHPDTLTIRLELAGAVGEQGRWKQAQAEYQEILAAQLRTLGPRDPEILTTRHNLAYAAGKLGQWKHAATAYRKLLDAGTRLLGPDHPDTLITRHELAYAMGKLGRWEQAEAAYRKLLDAQLRVLGPDHPDTQSTARDLAHAAQQLNVHT
jgi:tetratricopeptide (TPR) repeat protein